MQRFASPALLEPLPESDDQLIPAALVYRYTGLSAQTLAHRRVKRQAPSYRRIGSRIYYRAGDLRALIEPGGP